MGRYKNIYSKLSSELNREPTDDEIIQEIEQVINKLETNDSEFLDNLFDELKNTPEELEKILIAKINGAEKKEKISILLIPDVLYWKISKVL